MKPGASWFESRDRHMKRVNDFPLKDLGGHIGPRKPGERISAGRKLTSTRVPSLVERTNHLPKRRKLFSAQRTPEA